MSNFKKFMQERRSGGRKAIADLTNKKESGGTARDKLIVSVPLTDYAGNMVVRFLPNKPVNAGPNDDVDAYAEHGTLWYEKRYQHNFKMNDLPVIYDCPTSLGRDEIKKIDSSIKLDIEESEETDTELAQKYGLDVYLVNRIRHDGQCPICIQNRVWWKEDESIVSGFGGTKRNLHYFAWVLVKEVNGSTEHEWCDGKPRILHFKKTIFDILDRELNGRKVDPSKTSKHIKPDPTSIFYEMVDPIVDGKVTQCEGRDFLISAVKEKGYTTYKSEDEPSQFIGDPYPVATTDEEYEAIINAIKPLANYILIDHKFNTFEEIKARLDKAMKNDDEDDVKTKTEVDSDSSSNANVRDAVLDQLNDAENDGVAEEEEKAKESDMKRPTRTKSTNAVFDDMDF